DRWDIDNKVVYYLSKDYPEHLKPATREVFASWNKAWKEATGKEVLELRENSGQEPGDLRYNMIYFDTSEGGNRLLGYGPSVTNPRTGEIIKADVFLYGGTLKQSVYSTRKWAAAFENRPAQPAPQPPLPLLLGGEANGEASAALFDLGSLLGDKLRDLGSDVREAASLVNVSGIGRMRAVDESILEAFGDRKSTRLNS